MKRAEFINELSAKFFKIGKIAPVEITDADKALRDMEGVRWYIAGVYEKKDSRLIRRNISFYVVDEGKPTESVYYAEKLPDNILQTIPSTVFKDVVMAEISKRCMSGEIEKAIITSVNENEKFANVTTYTFDKDMIYEKKHFVYNDKDNVLQFRLIGE